MMQLRLKSRNFLNLCAIQKPVYSSITPQILRKFSTTPPPLQQDVPPLPPVKSSFLTSKFFQKWFGPQTYRASPTFKNRWLMVLPAFMTHLCIGSPWAWSVIVGNLILSFFSFLLINLDF